MKLDLKEIQERIKFLDLFPLATASSTINSELLIDSLPVLETSATTPACSEKNVLNLMETLMKVNVSSVPKVLSSNSVNAPEDVEPIKSTLTESVSVTQASCVKEETVSVRTAAQFVNQTKSSQTTNV